MKPIVLDNIFSEQELFYIYNELITTPSWIVNVQAHPIKYTSNKNFSGGAMFPVKREDAAIHNAPFYMWGQVVVFRIHELLRKKNIGIHTDLKRMWFLSTPTGSPLHFPHKDDDRSSNHQSILLFITPVWQTGWRGSFYIQGEEFKFKPGTAIIFDSQEFHTGEDSISESYNWQRITCNMMVGKEY